MTTKLTGLTAEQTETLRDFIGNVKMIEEAEKALSIDLYKYDGTSLTVRDGSTLVRLFQQRKEVDAEFISWLESVLDGK